MFMKKIFSLFVVLFLSLVASSQNIEKAMDFFLVEKFDSAAIEFEKVLPLIEKEYGTQDTSIVTVILIYAGVSCEYSMKYTKAEYYYLKAKAVFESIGAKKDPGYTAAINNLAKLYDDLGRYEEAEPLYLEVIELDKIILGENNPDFANDLSNLAALYYAMGRYKQSEPLYRDALEIIEKTLGKNNELFVLYANNLGQLYVMTGEFNKADTLFKHAIEIYRKIKGEDHAQYAKYLNNLAYLNFLKHDFETAETLYKKSLMITEKYYGLEHPSYAIKLNNLGSLYIEMDMIAQARESLSQAFKINQYHYGPNHPECLRNLNNLSKLYLKEGKLIDAISANKKAFNIYKFQIESNTGFLSENELKQFNDAFLLNLELYQSINIHFKDSINEVGDLAYNIELFRKGILLKSAFSVKYCIQNSGDTALLNAYHNLSQLRIEIGKLKIKAPNAQSESIIELEYKANSLEKKLTLLSKEYQILKQENKLTWQEIESSLKKGEAAIEFSNFHYYNANKSTDSSLYCAVLVRSNDTIPKMVYLTQESQLKKAIPAVNSSKEINFTYTGNQFNFAIEDNILSNDNQVLYNLVWKPIDSLLQGINTVYFAPSGLLNSVSLAAITCPDGKTLLEKYKLVQLSSTRTLALPRELEPIINAVVYGGIAYDTDTLTMLTKSVKYHEKASDLLVYNRSSTGLNRNGFRYLKGTKEEADQVSVKLMNAGISTTTYSGTDALEESFVALSGKNSTSVIHISTHGFYYPDTISDTRRKQMDLSGTGEMQFRYSEDPLLRSGLMMSGANLAWKGLPLPQNVEDGILTAKEISNMNLMNTELVVLSACQTGLGDVKGSEGVEGLHRGFKMAGVRYLIMSLWEVPDKETTEFMDTFYDNWLGGKEIHDAFRDTQAKIRKSYKDEPFKWAAFVLVE